MKARLQVAADIDAAAAIAAAKADPAVAAALEGKQVVKEIYVKGRLVNTLCVQHSPTGMPRAPLLGELAREA